MASRPPSPWARRRNLLAVALACALAAPAGTAIAQDLEALPPPPDAVVPSDQILYLDLVLDGAIVRALVPVSQRGGRLFLAPDELRLAGLELPSGLPVEPDGLVAADAVPGLNARFDAAMQQLVLEPDRALRRLQALGYQAPAAVEAQRDTGLRLDWDAFGRSAGDAHTLSLATAVRLFGRFGTFETTGVSRHDDLGSDDYARLDTRWTYSDPARLTTWTVGDLVSGGLAWTRPVRLGGVQWRRNFGVRPDLIVYPVPRFSADATVPSAVELFVDNVRQSRQDVGAGPFVLTEFPRVVGAGQAVVVVTDALGRTTQTSVSLYVDYQRLAAGLSDFSVEAGLLRRGFGVDGADYGDEPVASASWRRGLTDTFTLEAHGEAGPGLQLGGVGLAWSPGNRFGLVSASLAASGGDARGTQAGLGYQWFGQRFGADAYLQRATAGYRDLGTLEGGGRGLRAQDRATAWWRVPRGSLSVTWLRARDADDVPTRVVSAGLTQSWGRVGLNASVFDDDRSGTGASLSVSVPLGPDLNAFASVDRSGGRTRAAASVRRTAPYDGGWGWDAQLRDDGDAAASATFRGRAGEVTTGVERVAGTTGAYGQGFGSVVWMDGRVFASRRIGDAFAVVSTQGVPDVPILFENRVAGRTDAGGHLLLTDLRGWQRNRVALDPDALDSNVRVPVLERLVTPADSGGVRVAFDLRRIASASVLLHDDAGAPVAAGTRVAMGDGVAGASNIAIVGFDGELWIEGYVPGTRLAWSRGGRACTATLPPLPAGATRVGPLACVPPEPLP